jgi:hypothetical protein
VLLSVVVGLGNLEGWPTSRVEGEAGEYHLEDLYQAAMKIQIWI